MNRPHVIGTWGCPCAPCRAARPAIDAAIARLDNTRRCAAWLDCGNLAVPLSRLSFRGFCPECEQTATSG